MTAGVTSADDREGSPYAVSWQAVAAGAVRPAALVAPAAEPRCVGSGFRFTEGPVWSAREECFYFHDLHAATRWRWSERSGLEQVAGETRRGNGMALDVHGDLIVCESSTSSVVRLGRDGTREVVASHYEGHHLNCPNDVVVRATDGAIYFTDPELGRMSEIESGDWAPELGFRSVFRVRADGGTPELVIPAGELEQPNGLCFSPDESRLYVNDSPRAHVKAWDVLPDGMLSGGRVIFEGIGDGTRRASPDGMECDALGNLWVGGPGGAWVVSPHGELLGILETDEVVGSLVWGGPDLRLLLLTTATTVHVVRTEVSGARLPGNWTV